MLVDILYSHVYYTCANFFIVITVSICVYKGKNVVPFCHHMIYNHFGKHRKI